MITISSLKPIQIVPSFVPSEVAEDFHSYEDTEFLEWRQELWCWFGTEGQICKITPSGGGLREHLPGKTAWNGHFEGEMHTQKRVEGRFAADLFRKWQQGARCNFLCSKRAVFSYRIGGSPVKSGKDNNLLLFRMTNRCASRGWASNRSKTRTTTTTNSTISNYFIVLSNHTMTLQES